MNRSSFEGIFAPGFSFRLVTTQHHEKIGIAFERVIDELALFAKGAVVIQNVVAHDDASSLPMGLKYLIGPFQDTLVSSRIILQMKDDEFLATPLKSS